MSAQERALADLARLLDGLGVAYMIIGGLANAVWGEPRATLDIDATVWVPEAELGATVGRLTSALKSRAPDPLAFVRETRVLPLESADGVAIDLIFGLLPFEEEAIGRAVPVAVGGVAVRFCTAEDLILHKIVSQRERDLADARGVVLRRLPDLDTAYLEPRIEELSRLLDRPEIALRWREWRREAEAP